MKFATNLVLASLMTTVLGPPIGQVHKIMVTHRGFEPRVTAGKGDDYRSAALILSSIPAPGHKSFSPSRLNGTSEVLRCACRSWDSGAK